MIIVKPRNGYYNFVVHCPFCGNYHIHGNYHSNTAIVWANCMKGKYQFDFWKTKDEIRIQKSIIRHTFGRKRDNLHLA